MIMMLAAAIAAQTPASAETPPVTVPDINALAITLVKPAFPATAVAADADGSVVNLRVIVDENGSPISAVCIGGCHPMLKDAAELAAMTSRFKKLVKDGRPIKYQGTLMYTFVVKRVDWFRFATALESTRLFDNISLGPVAQMLSDDHSKERTSLLSLDEKGTTYETRQKVLMEVGSAVRAKLEGTERWLFDLGLALRRVTFWQLVGGPVDRPKLQKSISDLAPVIDKAPEEVSKELLDELRTISRYEVSMEMPERELRAEIGGLTRNLGPYLR